MNKMREYERGRADGLDLALRIVRSGGIEALEKEVRFRGITGIHTAMAVKDLEKASEKIKQMTFDTVTALSIAVLHDYFEFGKKRCTRYQQGMMQGTEYLMKGFATWPDYLKSIEEEMGMDVKIRWNY